MFSSKRSFSIKKIGKSILPAIFILLFVSAVYPCKCVNSSQRTHYKRADLVVSAKVLEVNDLGENSREIEIMVVNAWKNDTPQILKILIDKDSCEYQMAKGESHLLYLVKLDSGTFTTNLCSGNSSENQSGKKKVWLKKFAKRTKTFN